MLINLIAARRQAHWTKVYADGLFSIRQNDIRANDVSEKRRSAEQRFGKMTFVWTTIRENGWGSKFGMTKCRTADISKIRNFEYWNNETRVIRFFYVRIYSLFLWLFKFFEHLKYMFIIYHRIWNFWILIVLQIVKLKKFANFWNSTISELWLFFLSVSIMEIWWFSKF